MTVQIKAVVSDGRAADVQLVERLVLQAVNATADAVQRDFQRTTRTWRRKPAFSVTRAQRRGGDVAAAVGTDNDVYRYVARGTRPHVIYPRRGRYLRFQTGYRAKTRVRFLGSRPGGAFGGWVTAERVRHPGIAAREFEQVIAENNQQDFEARVGSALARGIRYGRA